MTHAANSNGQLNTDKPFSSDHPVADKVRETLHQSVDTVANKAAMTEESLRKSADSSAEAMAEKQAEMSAKWNNSKVKQYAVENPVATAGIAFAAGALIASFFGKKS